MMTCMSLGLDCHMLLDWVHLAMIHLAVIDLAVIHLMHRVPAGPTQSGG